MFDCHVHTKFSSDSNMRLEDVLKRIKYDGFGVIVTEHMDLKYPDEGKFQFDTKEYFREYETYRSDKILLGIELGLRLDCIAENKKIIEENPFDYVIGSIHVVKGIDIFRDCFYENKSKKEAYEEYLSYIYSCIKDSDFFDSLGHIDYITRYSIYDDKELYYEDFSDLIDEILKILSSKGKAIELNTRRLDNRVAADNMLKILKRFKELGGEFVTLGSDAHDIDSIGRHFKVAEEIIKMSKLRRVYFKNRKIELLPQV
ncbi:histidinol-phosphatase (PHP family) [Caloramator fervidus]|uniref:Histidinol-phosphatase n=1 Tax=Caloramator fervidus TaxID=29344 RepID=A0A1H5XIV1_9CLOT|nr:histidinol phosphate phosphatase [Caloramator fervidus]SEG11652.1 histidinol-phosphatase (PHP family) [Caloramator fervidus]